jgi:hypothetical protein
VGNTAPTAVIDAPSSALTWQVGQTISFSGHATDAQPASGSIPNRDADVQDHPGRPHAHRERIDADRAGRHYGRGRLRYTATYRKR